MPLYLLGLNAYHGDSSACIFKDGKLVAAIEEERIRRVKHWAGLPIESIKYCLDEAGISIDQVEYITISKDPKANIFKKGMYALSNLSKLHQWKNRVQNNLSINQIVDEICDQLGSAKTSKVPTLKLIEHHRSHMASSYYASPFEETALLSVDGMGDFTSCMMGVGKKGKIKVLDEINYPHSLGFFYSAMTQFLGFYSYGDEYKVMGLSSYGTPRYADQLRKVIKITRGGKFKLNSKFFEHFKSGVKMTWQDGMPTMGKMYAHELTQFLGPSRTGDQPINQYHMDMAASIQAVTEEVVLVMAEELYKKTKIPNICLSGGVAQNSVANGKIIAGTSFEKLYVPPAGHDAGTAIGSCLYFMNHELGLRTDPDQDWAFTGPKFTQGEIECVLQAKSIGYDVYSDPKLYDVVSDCLIDGGVVGWFQGRSEFGPRALGGRSIIVDPRREDAKELLNVKIKRRESFRPFAPSILKERVKDFFEYEVEVPYMEKVHKIREEKRHLIPAVTHVDGTGRLQTVEPTYCKRYHELISAFDRKTNIPILLNTSFNENEPIVNSLEDALNCFLRTEMDMLVLENVVVKRSGI